MSKTTHRSSTHQFAVRIGLLLMMLACLACGPAATPYKPADELLDYSTPFQVPSDWIKQETETVEFYLPPSIKGGKWSGGDSSGLTFENDQLVVDLEEGPYTFNFDFIVGTKHTTQINGRTATVFLGDLNIPFPGRAVNADGSSKPEIHERNLVLGALFKTDQGFRKAFMISARTREDLKIGKQILQSIRFK